MSEELIKRLRFMGDPANGSIDHRTIREAADALSRPAPAVQVPDEEAEFSAWADGKWPLAKKPHALGAWSREHMRSARDGWMARAALVAAPTPATVATEAVFQQVSEDDLSALESWLTERGHKNSAFFPADANRLADMTLHMIREVRASRKGVATEAATGKPALQVDAAQEAVAQGVGVDVEKVMALVLEYGHAIEQANAGFYGAMASEAISEKAAQIRALLTPAAGQGWQPIETAPKDGTTVLLAKFGAKYGMADGHYDGNCWVWPFVRKEPTYWLPLNVLPSPPAIANQEEGK